MMDISTRSRARLGSLAALLALAAIVIAGCGSSSTSSSAAAAAPSSTPAAASGGMAISSTKGSAGTYLTGASGRAVYLWVADTGGKSNCAGQCAKFWPPVLATATPTAAGGANAKDLAMITRSDGAKQVTYKGHPLYYFLEDKGPGTTHGQGNNGFGAKWWLIAPSGTAITASSSPGAASSGTKSSSGGGGYGSGY